MGTQFWWFFDTVFLSAAIGFIYSGIAKGFNKGVFRLAGFLCAIVLGFYGSFALKDWVYDTLFSNSVVEALDTVTTNEEWDVFEKASELMALSAMDEKNAPDPEDYEKIFRSVTRSMHREDGSAAEPELYPDWFIRSVCDVTEAAVSAHKRPHSSQRLSVLYNADNDYTGFVNFIAALRSDSPQDASAMLEAVLYRPNYVHMIRMAVFLLIGAVVLIIFGIISSMAGSMEEQMHLKRGNHLLGAVVGITEAVGITLMMVAAIQLIVTASDSQMLVFNPETIGQTKVFKYIYEAIPW